MIFTTVAAGLLCVFAYSIVFLLVLFCQGLCRPICTHGPGWFVWVYYYINLRHFVASIDNGVFLYWIGWTTPRGSTLGWSDLALFEIGHIARIRYIFMNSIPKIRQIRDLNNYFFNLQIPTFYSKSKIQKLSILNIFCTPPKIVKIVLDMVKRKVVWGPAPS